MSKKSIEEDLLGLCLNSDAEYLSVCDRVRAEHFTSEANAAIWKAVDQIRRAGKKPEDSLIEAACEGVEFEVTLSAYLYMLRGNCPEGVHADDFAGILIDRWTRRTFSSAVEKLKALAEDKDLHSEDLVETACRKLTKEFEAEAPSGIYTPADYLRDRQEVETGKVKSGEQVYTNFEPFDDMVAPLQPGDMIVAGGATSSGKSSLVQLLCWKAAQSGTPVLFITNEMTGKQAMQRMVAQISNVELGTVINPRQANNGEREAIADAEAVLSQIPVTIYQGGSTNKRMKCGQIRLVVMRMVRQHDIRLVIIDHLQFIGADDTRAKEHEQLAQITADLKRCAIELSVPIILVSHLNRDAMNHDAKLAKDIKRPRLGNLYGSSAIEKDADAVVFVHRPEYFLERAKPQNTNNNAYYAWAEDMDKWKGLAELVLVKRRQGKGFEIRTVLWDGPTTTLRMRGSEATQAQERMAV